MDAALQYLAETHGRFLPPSGRERYLAGMGERAEVKAAYAVPLKEVSHIESTHIASPGPSR